jgi:hypothetical protein
MFKCLVLQKKVIDTQLEGFSIGRYTISPEIANGLYPNLVRFFQYGDALVKQKQQIDDKSKMGAFGMGPPMKTANAPQMQSNQNETHIPLGRMPHQMLSQAQFENVAKVNQVNSKANQAKAGGPSTTNSQLQQLQQQQLQQAAHKRQQQYLAKLSAQKQLQQGGVPPLQSLPPTELQDFFADPTPPLANSPFIERVKSSSPISPRKLLGTIEPSFFLYAHTQKI